jgi:uncharacterized protein YbjQ (UPF0145 family)
MKICSVCKAENQDDATDCRMCYSLIDGVVTSSSSSSDAEELALIQAHSENVKVFTTFDPKSITIIEELGLVFGNSSKQAFWGLSTQANRLSRAYEAALANLKYDAALMGADAVIGVTFALNNSSGSAAMLAGSSEAVMLLGTAVKTK